MGNDQRKNPFRRQRGNTTSDRGPSRSELQAIEAEWPLIAAELAVVDAEIAAARVGDEMTELGRRRFRRAESRLTRQIVADAAVDGSFGGAA